MGIARRSTPREYWDTAVFRHVNVVLSAVWAATFTVAAGFAGALTLLDASPLLFAAMVPLYVVPVVVTRRYPAAVRARYAAATAAGS